MLSKKILNFGVVRHYYDPTSAMLNIYDFLKASYDGKTMQISTLYIYTPIANNHLL